MKKALTGLVALMVSGCATYDTYTAEDFEARTAQHDTVAILPFDVTIVVQELPEEMTEADIQAQEQDEAFVFQRQLYVEFLERYEQDEYSVEFQDIDTTNVLLERSDIEYRDIGSHTKNELSGLLGVDAVIAGAISRTQPMGTGGAIATAVVSGILGAATGGSAGVRGITNEVNVTITIHDGEEGTLLWSFDEEVSGGLGSSPESLTEQMMRSASRAFPYASAN